MFAALKEGVGKDASLVSTAMLGEASKVSLHWVWSSPYLC